tara:strand:+ start:14664 stop:14855 length:192 start_codon:yes stop_codon:yes gene_type:complete
MNVFQYVKYKLKEKRAIKDCQFNEPLHYHHDGCPSCDIPLFDEQQYWEYMADRNPDDGSWAGR